MNIPSDETEFKELLEKYEADRIKRLRRSFNLRKLWALSKIEEFNKLKEEQPKFEEMLNETFEDFLEKRKL